MATADSVTYSQPESGYRNDTRTYTGGESVIVLSAGDLTHIAVAGHATANGRPCPYCDSTYPDSLDDPFADAEPDADGEP